MQAQWACVIDSLESELIAKLPTSAGCVRAAQSPAPATHLRPIAWSLEDRHLLAARIRGDRWFQITTAADWWAMISDNHGTVGRLVQRADRSRQTASSVVEAVRTLTRARLALAPHVALDG